MSYIEKSFATTETHRGHVLLISPLTFSYHISISETLNSMGFDVTWWNDKSSSSTWYKLLLRLFPTWTACWSERSFLERLTAIDSASITHIMVIKGEGLSQRIVFKVRESLPMASMGLYLWDGFANVKGVSKILQAFDSVATFDPVDAKTFDWTYRPLFWRNISISEPSIGDTQFDWCFVGTVHSDRHGVIHRLRQGGGLKMRNFVFAYFQSPLILFIRHLVDWTLWVAPPGTLSTKPMSAVAVAQTVACSTSVLDVEHPRQRGFTMRTIETLLAGKKLVTTNKHISASNLYHPSRIHIISRVNPEIPTEFLKQPYVPVSNELRSYYSCEGWATELLNLQDTGRRKRQRFAFNNAGSIVDSQ